jgi:hypothetical protein
MVDINFWVNNPDFRLFKEEDPDHVEWCRFSENLVAWGATLLDRLTQDPTPDNITLGIAELWIRYRIYYYKVEKDHRAETNLDNHPCLHQAMMEIGDKIDDLRAARGIRQLEPPQPVARSLVQVEAEPMAATEEITGIIIGERRSGS